MGSTTAKALRWGPCVTRDHTVLPATHTRTIPAFTPQPQGITALWLVLIAPTHEGIARLSWPGWLATYRDKCLTPGIEHGYGHPPPRMIKRNHMITWPAACLEKFDYFRTCWNIVQIAKRYDILLVQEIRDSSETAVDKLIDAVNAETG